MKKYFAHFALTALSIVPAMSLADYDKFSCVTNTSLELSQLQCISCGLTKYYADQGFEVTPSHKWLAMIALKVRENKGTNHVNSPEGKEVYQKEIIRKIQEYGFCNEYLGKDTFKNGRSKTMHDMSAEDWKLFNEFLNRGTVPTPEQYDSIARKLGFKTNGWPSYKGGKKNMDYLFEGFDDNLSLDDKRKIFKERLNEALKPDYNVSGERNEKSKEFIASSDEDQGLRNCLGEIKRKFFLEKNMSDKDSYKMCEVVANACDLQRKPMGADDFCVHKGMGLRPVAPAKPLAPPPSPKGQGTK